MNLKAILTNGIGDSQTGGGTVNAGRSSGPSFWDNFNKAVKEKQLYTLGKNTRLEDQNRVKSLIVGSTVRTRTK